MSPGQKNEKALCTSKQIPEDISLAESLGLAGLTPQPRVHPTSNLRWQRGVLESVLPARPD